MRKLITAAALAVGIAFGSAAVAPVAEAAVPYSWWCYKPGRAAVHVYTPAGVGYWQGRLGYRCEGGFWRYV